MIFIKRNLKLIGSILYDIAIEILKDSGEQFENNQKHVLQALKIKPRLALQFNMGTNLLIIIAKDFKLNRQ